MVIKGSKTSIKTKNLFLTGQTVNLDAMVNGHLVKNKYLTWKSSDKSVVSVNKIGVIKAVKASDKPVYVSFTTKGKKKVTVKIAVTVCVRASKMMLTPSAVTVKAGEKAEVAATFELSEKVKAAKAEDTTYNVFAKSSDESIAKVSVDGRKIVVEGVAKSATPVTITVYSTQVKSLKAAEKAKIKLEEKFEVKVNDTLSAKQTGANKITVMGNDFVASKGAFVVKNSSGVVLPLKDEVKLNEAKTEAVLEGDTTQIPVGKYTLTYNNGDTVEFEVVKAVVKRIEIVPTGKAIMVKPAVAGAKVEKARVYYKVFNQFDEDITKNPIASRIQVTGSDSPTLISKGVVEFTSTNASSGYQLNLSQISVAIVELDTGVNASAVLTAGEYSKVWETEYKGLYDITKRKFVESISEDSKLSDYTLVVGAKDQYGNNLVKEANKKDIQINLLSITGVVAKNGDEATIISIGDDDYYSFPLKNAVNGRLEADRSGEVSVQTIIVNNGKTETKKFNVEAANKVDTLNVRAGALGVYENQDNELDFTALDVNGKELTSWEALKELNDPKYIQDYVNANAGSKKLKFVKKSNGKVALMYNPGNDVVNGTTDTASITRVLTFVTKTNKFSTANISVREARTPSTILGLVSDAVKGTTKNHTLTITADKIRFQDQYGNNMTSQEVVNSAAATKKYGIKVTLNDYTSYLDLATSNPAGEFNQITKADDEIVKLKAVNTNDKSGSAKVTLELYYVDNADTTVAAATDVKKVKSSEDKSFDVYNVLLKDLSSFSIEDPGLRPASNLDTELTNPAVPGDGIDNSKKGFEPKVIGYYAGQKITLTKADDFTIFKADTSTDATYVPVPKIEESEKNVVVRKAVAKVVIKDEKATTIEKEYSYSNEARKPAKVEMAKTELTQTGATPQTWTVISAASALDIKVKDQYGSVIANMNPFISYSDFDEKEVTVTNNGTKDAQVVVNANTEANLTVKFSFPGTSYTFEKIIKITRGA